MALGYKVVGWTPFKRAYDWGMAAGLAAFLGTFLVVSALSAPAGQSATPVQLLIRGFGVAAFALLHLILAIGPLARLSPRFKPFLFNRRHMGVTCFVLALAHAGLSTLWYHGFSDVNPLVSLLVSNPRYDSIGGFPFEALGVAALFVLFVMAATSHDFWNANLGPGLWKAIHMAVYPAYALLVAHVMLGAVQGEKSLLYPIVTGVGAATITALHLVAAVREWARDRAGDGLGADGWLRVGPGGDIPDRRARIVSPPRGERIAVFRDGGKIFAVSNVCRHQGGPLGEGRIIDGCITCPWHGFQYLPENGRSPPPYGERIATYRTRLEGDVVFVHPEPLPPGTAVAASLLPGGGA